MVLINEKYIIYMYTDLPITAVPFEPILSVRTPPIGAPTYIEIAVVVSGGEWSGVDWSKVDEDSSSTL